MAVSTTRGPAEQVVAGAGVDSPGTRVWLVVLHGHFQDPGASLPSGAPIPTGSIISFTINKQSHHIMDFGIGDRSPNLLSLGQVKSIGRANFSPARSTVSLILAEPDFARNFGDPLWVGWPGDSPRLRMLARAIGQARRLGTVKSIAGLQDSFWPLVQLGYGNGRVVPLTWMREARSRYSSRMVGGNSEIRIPCSGVAQPAVHLFQHAAFSCHIRTEWPGDGDRGQPAGTPRPALYEPLEWWRREGNGSGRLDPDRTNSCGRWPDSLAGNRAPATARCGKRKMEPHTNRETVPPILSRVR